MHTIKSKIELSNFAFVVVVVVVVVDVIVVVVVIISPKMFLPHFSIGVFRLH